MPAVSAEYAAGQGDHRQVYPTFDNCIKPWKIEPYPTAPLRPELTGCGGVFLCHKNPDNFTKSVVRGKNTNIFVKFSLRNMSKIVDTARQKSTQTLKKSRHAIKIK
jgi:hypothetical protein